MTDQNGRILAGRYKIIEKLGEGGFGNTYKAKDLQLVNHPICVAKQFKPNFTDPGAREYAVGKFFQEAETLQKLGEHPQIPRLLAYFQDQDDYYLVQQYISGHTLDQEIIYGRPLPDKKIIDILIQVLKILLFVQDNNVIHRDIKPENIIRRSDDNALILIDFGLVREITPGQNFKSTFIFGTPGYIPPEQEKGEPNFFTDVYALGVIGIEALKGERINPNAPSGVLFRRQSGEVVWEKEDRWSSELDLILRSMVQPESENRYSVSEALQALENLDLSHSLETHTNSIQSHIELPNKIAIRSPNPQETLKIDSLDKSSRKKPNLTVSHPPIKWLWVGGGISMVAIALLLNRTISDPSFPFWISEEQQRTRVFEKANPAVVKVVNGKISGSGFIVSSDGLILTNSHVVENSHGTVKVFSSKDEELQGDVVGYEEKGNDLAAIKIRGAQNLPTVNLVQLDSIKVGQSAYAIGSYQGQTNLTEGYVKSIDTKSERIFYSKLVNPETYGGPLLNAKAEVIGVNMPFLSARIIYQQGSQVDKNIEDNSPGFAIAVDKIRTFLDAVKSGTAPRKAQRKEVPPTVHAEGLPLDGQPVNGHLDKGSAKFSDNSSYYKPYSFEGRKGQQISINLTSKDGLDTSLFVIDPKSLEIIAQNDDTSPTNSNSTLTVTLPKDGVYLVLASAFGPGEPGSFSLTAAIGK